MDVSYVSQLERGLRDPSLTSLSSLAKAFGLSVSEFLADGTGPSPVDVAARLIASELAGLGDDALPDYVALIKLVRRLSSAP